MNYLCTFYLFTYLMTKLLILSTFFSPEITFYVWILDNTSCKPKADSQLSLQSWNKSINAVIWG